MTTGLARNRSARHLVCVAVLAVASAGRALQAQPAAAGEGPTLPDWMSRLEVGTRTTVFWLEDDKRDINAMETWQGSFYGSITKLKAAQDYRLVKLFVDYKFTPYVMAEFTWEEIRADTFTRVDGHCDGRVHMKGPLAALIGRYANPSPYQPYAGIGWAYFFNTFEENEAWRFAYHNLEQWFELDDSMGWFVCVGLSVCVFEDWCVDVYLRHMGVDVRGTHYHYREESGETYPAADFTFPMDNDAIGIGVRHMF